MIRKMEITIENFRKHKKLSLTFNNGEIIHITGDVGSGKSTILNAIFWCLYGKLQQINDNTNTQEHKTVVSIYFDKLKLKIYRQHNPNYLEVIDNTIKYIGDAAQTYIIDKFCNIDLWFISSYISQKNRRDFFNYSNKEKLKLLNQIAFKNINIEDEKKKIEVFYKNINNEYEKKLYNFNSNYNNFQNQIKLKEYNSNFKEENLKEYTDILNTYNNTEIELKKLLLIQENLKGKYQTLTNQKQYYLNQLSALNFDNTINIDYNQIINDLENKISNLQNKQNYIIELRKIIIDNNLPKIEFTEKDYIDAKNYENIYYNQYLPLLNKYNSLKSQITNIIDFKITDILIIDVKNNENKIKEKNQLIKELEKFNLSEDEKLLSVSWELYNKVINQTNNYYKYYLPLKEEYNNLLKSINKEEDLNNIITDEEILNVKNQEYRYNLYISELNKYKISEDEFNINWSIKDHQDLINNWNLYNNEQNTLSKMRELLEKIADYRYKDKLTKELIYNMKEQKKLYLKEKIIIDKYLITKENKEVIINDIKKKIIYLENYNDIQEYNKLVQMKFNYTLDEVNNLIAQLKISDKILKCPKCQENLILKNNNLEISNIHTHIEKVDINNLEFDKKILQRIQELKYKLSNIDLNIEINNLDNLNNQLNNQLNILNKDVNDINNLTFVEDINYDIEKLEYIYEYQQYYNSLQNIIMPKYSIEESIKMLKIMEIKNLKSDAVVKSSNYLILLQKVQKCKIELQEMINKEYNILPINNANKIKEVIEYNQLKDKIESIKVINYDYTSDDLLKNYELQNINIEKYDEYKQEAKYKADYILQIIKNNENIKKYQQIKEKIADNDNDDYSVIIEELKNKLIENKKMEKIYNDNKNKYYMYISSIENIDKELESIKINDKLEEQYNYVINQIKLISLAIEDCKYSLMMQEKHKVLIEEYEILKNLSLDVAAASDLYKDAVSVECEHLKNIINSINNNLNIVYSKLFKYNIKVELKLNKKLKSKKKNKNEVNIVILYKGAEYKDINALSGGEEDMIVFGLTVVLSSMFEFPMLMIDEYFKYINADYVECCVNVLKEYVNKTILIVSQKDIENRYDKVYDLDNIL